MKFIKEFSKFEEIDILSDEAIENIDKEIIMSILFKYRNKDIGDKLEKIINRFKKNSEWGNYNTPDDWFEKNDYKTFMQYFKRKLSKDKFEEIKSQQNEMSLPCECNIESIGKLSDLSQIIRLKKSTDSVIDDLKKLGVRKVEKLGFINMKLLKVYYHRVHSPIDGEIKNIIEVSPDDNFFGENNLWILEIENSNFETVYLILVGELSIQDFKFKVKKGENVHMFQEIGNFNWASQVIILYDINKFNEIKIKSNKKYFIGEPIF
jgi:phosphatidylserine decarboxylase